MIILALALGSLLYLDPWAPVSTPQQRLSDLEQKRISRIRIDKPKRAPIVLERRERGWLMLEPFAMRAAGHTMRALLALVSAASEKRMPADNLERFGLDPAKGRIQFDETTFDFGATEPLSNRRYLLVANTVHLSPDRFYHYLLMDATRFVARELLPAGARIDEVHTDRFRLSRSAKGGWLGLAPEAGADAGNSLIDRWRAATARSISTYDPELPWQRSVELRGDFAGAALRFDVAEGAGELVFGRPEVGIQYHLPTTAGEALLRTRAQGENREQPLKSGASGSN